MDIFLGQYRAWSALNSHIKPAGLEPIIGGWNEPEILCGKLRHRDELDCLSIVVSVEFFPIAGVLEQLPVL